MPETPTYDTVMEDLQIDPEQIAARPAWSFKVAEKVRKHRQKARRSAAPKKRTQGPRTKQAQANQTRAKHGQTKRATASR